MHQPRWSDLARQFANIFAAIFQVYASYTVGETVGRIAQEQRSAILPATYAFAIWGPIFILCGTYAIVQALPAQRENPVFRTVGWWSAGAFLANGAWTYAYTNQQFILAQAILSIAFLLAGGAFLRHTGAAATGGGTAIEARVTAVALGLLFGWITAANVVGLAGTLVALGFAATGPEAEIVGAALLLVGGGVAFFVIRAARPRSSDAWISYGAAVLWALVAVIVEQRSVSIATSAAAAFCSLLVLVAMFGPWESSSPASGRRSAAI
jgi:hypothetical protein